MATSHKVILAETLSPTFVGLTFQVFFIAMAMMIKMIVMNDDDDDDEDSLPDLCWSHFSGGFDCDIGNDDDCYDDDDDE